jgi:alpha-tubulin suppressor-like RCC1 family protein
MTHVHISAIKWLSILLLVFSAGCTPDGVDRTSAPADVDAGDSRETTNDDTVEAEAGPEPESIRLDDAPYTLRVGEIREIDGYVTYTDGTLRAETSSLGWRSANDSVATVEADGQLRGVSVGTTELIVTKGPIEARADIRVVEAGRLEIAEDTLMLATTSTYAVEATARDENGMVVDAPAIDWSSSDRTIISVSSGELTARTAGQATITGRWRGLEDSVEVQVSAVDRVEIQPDIETIYTGDRLQLELRAFGDEGRQLDGVDAADVVWSTDLPERASISADGRLSAFRPGYIEVTATYQGTQTQRTYLIDVRFREVECQEEYCVAVSEQGYLYGVGRNFFGELADPTVDFTETLLRIEGDVALESIDLANNHGCGLTKAGKAFCWGMNLSGSLGFDTPESEPHPLLGTPVGMAYEIQPVDTAHRFVQIETHHHATFGLTDSGEVYVWGHWPAGYHREDPIPPVTYPRPTLFDAGPWAGIADTALNLLCLKDTNGFQCMGFNERGIQGRGEQAPDETTTLGQWPTSVPMRSLAGSYNVVCGLDTNDQVWCTGNNREGAMGQPFDPLAYDAMTVDERFDTHTYYEPMRSTWADTFERLWAGEGEFFCGERNREIWCWGSNASCQLGWDPGNDITNPLHVYSSSDTPVKMDFIPDDWQDIGLGSWFGCLVDGEGALRCWGLGSPRANPYQGLEPLQCNPALQRVLPYEPR